MKHFELYDARTTAFVWSGFLSYTPQFGCLIQLNPQPDETKPNQKPRVFSIQGSRLSLQEGIATEIGSMRLVGVEIDINTGKPIESLVQAVSPIVH